MSCNHLRCRMRKRRSTSSPTPNAAYGPRKGTSAASPPRTKSSRSSDPTSEPGFPELSLRGVVVRKPSSTVMTSGRARWLETPRWDEKRASAESALFGSLRGERHGHAVNDLHRAH